jgi:L-rhamnose mutarotase
MERKVYCTRIKPEYREQYMEAHRNVPKAVLERYRELGMTHCAVYLLDDLLVLITEAKDQAALSAGLESDPVDRTWQEYVRPMKADGDYREMTPVFISDL